MGKPRVGFLGVGWIGRHRMEAMLATGTIEAAAIVEPSAEAAEQALALAPAARRVNDLDTMLALGLDGIVIASPSALHAKQSIHALEAGVAVFCQKPLGRNAKEVAAVVATAEKADRLLGVDLSYRFTDAMRRIAPLVREGRLGGIQAVDLTFHNAYGPDKSWFYDRVQSGGGCVIDLGIHLVDLALWTLGFPEVLHVSSHLFADGTPMRGDDKVEDLALATLIFAGGTVVRLACSWRVHAGRDAVIEAAFYGSDGGAALRNVDGSFYDFTAEHFLGTHSVPMAVPPDDWGTRAGADWAIRLAQGERFDRDARHFVDVAQVLDRIYAATERPLDMSSK
jgi:predicted dehydrogenase